ncbi:YHYH protein [Imperialibacter roseus]|uniref:YHYH protein n=1 Tax=Imperialibacter roseus TaxID=1324217 RepID=A0ABZ0ISI9_9BACT|nr:YHYH protein [Imperialibacter roseus]WOK07355.1 YHYH protein [Imperialibacter roseus]
MTSIRHSIVALSIFCLTGMVSCGGEDDADDIEVDEDPTEEITNDVSILVDKFTNKSALTIVVGENNITITTKDQPDHKSMYYESGNSLYEAYDEPNNPEFKKNPHNITTQNIVMKIPRFPEKASTHKATSMGPIGIAVNSVALFNQAAAPGDDILDELNTFDQYEGHPQQQGMYHYHTEPVYITQTEGDDAFLGFLLDGFPVYGPFENGKRLSNDDLDDYHGHTTATADFPDGIYHYHATDELPWINGDGYYGTPGTITF